MKTKLTKALLALFAVFISLAASAQTDNRFYASLEDMINDKPVPNIEIEEKSWGETMGSESLKVITNGKAERTKISKLPYEFLTYNKWPMRAYDGDIHIILTVGKYCLYSAYTVQNALFTSETISGKLNEFDEKGFKKHLAAYGLLEDYRKDEPKAEKKDSANDLFNKRVAWRMKYFKLLNEKAGV